MVLLQSEMELFFFFTIPFYILATFRAVTSAACINQPQCVYAMSDKVVSSFLRANTVYQDVHNGDHRSITRSPVDFR